MFGSCSNCFREMLIQLNGRSEGCRMWCCWTVVELLDCTDSILQYVRNLPVENAHLPKDFPHGTSSFSSPPSLHITQSFVDKELFAIPRTWDRFLWFNFRSCLGLGNIQKPFTIFLDSISPRQSEFSHSDSSVPTSPQSLCVLIYKLWLLSS